MDFNNVEVQNEYFDWLYDYVCQSRVHDKNSYKKLFMVLHNTEFIFSIPNDINRAKDGEDLRWRFISYIDDREHISIPFKNVEGPCSVLEMMIALAIRCEESIMDDAQYGDRTSQWFWGMMKSLGIGLMSDDVFDRDYILEHINRFLYRQYEPNGKGGLFYIRDTQEDLRDVEIWIQLCWYLDQFA